LLAESHFGFVLKPWTRHLLYAESTQHTRLEGETRLAMFYCWDTRQGTEIGGSPRKDGKMLFIYPSEYDLNFLYEFLQPLFLNLLFQD
jgi:hypothetical protein